MSVPVKMRCPSCGNDTVRLNNDSGYLVCSWLHCPKPIVSHALKDLVAERDRLHGLINSPEIADFAKAVVLEAAHQRERWKGDDAQKSAADWFWLIGYLAGKALSSPLPKDMALPEVDRRAKHLHRIITIAAAAGNWHRALWERFDVVVTGENS